MLVHIQLFDTCGSDVLCLQLLESCLNLIEVGDLLRIDSTPVKLKLLISVLYLKDFGDELLEGQHGLIDLLLPLVEQCLVPALDDSFELSNIKSLHLHIGIGAHEAKEASLLWFLGSGDLLGEEWRWDQLMTFLVHYVLQLVWIVSSVVLLLRAWGWIVTYFLEETYWRDIDLDVYFETLIILVFRINHI